MDDPLQLLTCICADEKKKKERKEKQCKGSEEQGKDEQ